MKLILISEASKLTGISRQTLRNWIDNGSLPHQKISSTFYVDKDTIMQLFEPMTDVEKARRALEAERDKYIALKEEQRACNDYAYDERNMNRLYAFSVNNGIRSQFFVSVIELMKANEMLTERDGNVLIDVVNGKDLSEIAANYGMTRERIRQIAETAIRKSRHVNNIKDKIDSIKRYEDEIKILKTNLETYKRIASQGEKNVLLNEKEQNISKMDRNELILLLNKDIRDCGFSVRTMTALVALDVKTIGDLCGMSKLRFLSCRGAGKKSLNEVDYFLHSLGLGWGINVNNILSVTI